MRKNADHTDQSFQNDGIIPVTIANALMAASEEISGVELWVPRRRSDIISAIPRIMAIIMAARMRFAHDQVAGSIVRQRSLRVVAYLPADLRLAALIDLSIRNPMALDDLMSGPISSSYEIYRYNILSSLGIFARHGIIEESSSMKRSDTVGTESGRSAKAGRAQ